MESKIISLENKLSCTVTEKKKAVYNIEELCGELNEDKKRNMEMYLDGQRTYQKSIRTYLKEKLKLENEIKTLKDQTETHVEENDNLRIKANQYDLLQRHYGEKVEQCVNQQLQIEKLKSQIKDLQTAQKPSESKQIAKTSSTGYAHLCSLDTSFINSSVP